MLGLFQSRHHHSRRPHPRSTAMAASRFALELMGHQRGEYQFCSPNDHVNRSQSTNDAYPTAIHIGLYYTHLKLVKHLEVLIESFRKKANEFAHVIKMGRTQLDDAVPMTLGQTFNGFASILSHEISGRGIPIFPLRMIPGECPFG